MTPYQIKRIRKFARQTESLMDMLYKIDPEGNTGSPASIMEDALHGFMSEAKPLLAQHREDTSK